MAAEKEVQGGVEWRVTVPEGSTAVMEYESGRIRRAWDRLASLMLAPLRGASDLARQAWKMGVDDPRKAIHGVKVGIALTLVSLFYYTRPLYDGVGGSAMWAVMTVVVVFEYTVGGCLYKGFNRALATLSAGAIAVSIHWFASKSGEKFEPVILSGSVFLLASAATFSRFIPTIKARFDYGITIFILTFSLVAVSGYRVDQLLELAEQRMSTIAIGICICLFVCLLVRPVWAGVELHLLMCRNMDKLADSLQGCVEDYFMDTKESSSAKSQGYKCILNSKASEDSQANLARWEPGHGKFGFRHPWNQYLKVAAAMRCCAYCVEALDACTKSKIQASEHMKNHVRDACMSLSSNSSSVLKELSSSIMSMRRSQIIDSLVKDMKDSAQDLKSALRTLPSCQSTQTPTATLAGDASKASLVDALPLITAASLLMEVSVRMEGVVTAVDVLASLAGFESPEKDENNAANACKAQALQEGNNKVVPEV